MHRLEPFGEARRSGGAPPDAITVAPGEFSIHLDVGAFATRLDCDVLEPRREAGQLLAPVSGSTTINLADRFADEVTMIEYRVLWAMTADRRQRRGNDPVSYTRIVRSLGLDSRRQAVAAVERLTRRFRAFGLLPADTPSERQRMVMCERAADLGLLERLEARLGSVDTDAP
ncbi:MAG: hypothetical protein U0Q22_19540 [Acidimicrobiales bacterium]